MEDNVLNIIPFKTVYSDGTSEKLYKIFGENKFFKNTMLEYIQDILSLIDTSKIKTSPDIVSKLIRLFCNSKNESKEFIEYIFDFLINEELLDISGEDVALTNYGKLFLMSDDISSTLDIIRYFWEKCDWNKLTKSNTDNKYLEASARRYIACLLYQIEDSFIAIDKMKEKYEDLEDLLKSRSLNIEELINNKNFYKILKYVFEPLGILKILYENDDIILKISEGGRKIFEYYSFDIEEEYKKLIDECWGNYDKGNFQSAYEIAKSILSVVPNIPDTYNIIGCVYIKRKEYNKAISVFKYAIDICENKIVQTDKGRNLIIDAYVSVYYNLGLCYYYTGEYMKAIKVLMVLRKTVPYRIEGVETIIDAIKKIIVIS